MLLAGRATSELSATTEAAYPSPALQRSRSSRQYRAHCVRALLIRQGRNIGSQISARAHAVCALVKLRSAGWSKAKPAFDADKRLRKVAGEKHA